MNEEIRFASPESQYGGKGKVPADTEEIFWARMSDDYASRLKCGNLLVRQYRYREAVELYRKAERIRQDDPVLYLRMSYCNTNHMNAFLRELSAAYPKDYILLVTDGAAWHSAKALVVPENIKLLRIPPYTPEMNPIEQIWKFLRSVGFRNEIFRSLADVVDRLCDIVTALTNRIVSSITCREWIKFLIFRLGIV